MSRRTQPAGETPRSPTLRAPIGEEVYKELLSRILSAELQPEERITIDAVVRDLGVSQTPIREALHRLEADGVVVRAHLAGYRVAPQMTSEQFESLIEIRQLLEPAAARRAAEHATDDDVTHLRELATAMTPEMLGTGESHGYALFSQRDSALHHAIASASGNDFIRDAVVRLHTHVHLFRLSDRADITQRAIVEHEAIITALAQRDPDAAADAMRAHIAYSAERFRRAFD